MTSASAGNPGSAGNIPPGKILTGGKQVRKTIKRRRSKVRRLRSTRKSL